MPTPYGGELLWLLPATGLTDQSTAGVTGLAYNGGMGVSGGKYVFDGTDDFITIPSGAFGSLTTQLSLTFWVNVTAFTNTDARIIERSSFGTANGFSVILNGGTGRLRINIDQVDRTLGAGDALVTGTQYFIAVTYNGTTLQVYRNATSVLSEAVSINLESSSAETRLGKSHVSLGYLHAAMDDIRVFNTGLTGSDVITLYNSGTPGYSADTQNADEQYQRGKYLGRLGIMSQGDSVAFARGNYAGRLGTA